MVTPEFFTKAKIQDAKKDRFLALGMIGGRAYAVVFQVLGTEAISIISLRRASRKERRLL